MSEYDLEIYFSPPHEPCGEATCEKCRRQRAWDERKAIMARINRNMLANRVSVKAIPAHLLEAFE